MKHRPVVTLDVGSGESGRKKESEFACRGKDDGFNAQHFTEKLVGAEGSS